MGPRISARFSDPQSNSTSVRANGNVVPGPRLNVVNVNIEIGNELCSNSYMTTYLVMRLPETTTGSSIYSNSTQKIEKNTLSYNNYNHPVGAQP